MYQHIQYLYLHKYGACNMYVSTCTLLSQSVSSYGMDRCGRDSNSLPLCEVFRGEHQGTGP